MGRRGKDKDGTYAEDEVCAMADAWRSPVLLPSPARAHVRAKERAGENSETNFNEIDSLLTTKNSKFHTET